MDILCLYQKANIREMTGNEGRERWEMACNRTPTRDVMADGQHLNPKDTWVPQFLSSKVYALWKPEKAFNNLNLLSDFGVVPFFVHSWFFTIATELRLICMVFRHGEINTL